MFIKKAINEKFLKLILAGFLAYYFGLIILQSNFKAAAVLGVAIYLIIFLTRTEYAFYFLLASRSLVSIFYDFEAAGNVRMTHLIGISLVGLFLYYIIVVYRRNIFSLDINKIYGVFLVVSVPAIFFSQSLTEGLGYWFRLFQGFLILNLTILVVLNAGSESYKKKINIICWTVIIALIAPYILFLKNYIQGIYVVLGDYERYSSVGAYANFFSYLLMIVFAFCLFLYSTTIRNSKKILWLIFMAMIVFAIYISYTRNVWIGLAILIATLSTVKKKFMITFFTIGIIILVIILNPAVQERLSDIYVILSGESFFDLDPRLGSRRIDIWQDNLSYFIEHNTLIERLFGNGFDIRSIIALTFSRRRSIAEHNTYLALLMNVGIFGLSTYLLYLIKLIQESFKLLKRTKEVYLRNLAQVFISLLLSYVVIITFTHILWNLTFQYYFSVFAGLIIAANIIEERSTTNEKKID